MAVVSENINRTRSRIVQSPERIKRNISTMGHTAAEDKRTVAANEAKTRDLQTKIAALLNIEKVRVQRTEAMQAIAVLIAPIGRPLLRRATPSH